MAELDLVGKKKVVESETDQLYSDVLGILKSITPEEVEAKKKIAEL